MLFLFSLSKIVAPESIPIGMNLNFSQCIFGLVAGLYMMGYKAIPRTISEMIRG